jgi:hypothetical protein
MYIFDTIAIVASANLSENSADLLEAGVLVTDPLTVRRLRTYARRLQNSDSALPMNDDAVLAELAKLEPKRSKLRSAPRSQRPRGPRIPFFDNDSVWLSTMVWDEAESASERKAKSSRSKDLASELGVESGKIQWMNEVGKATKNAVRPYDWMFFWWPTRHVRRRARMAGSRAHGVSCPASISGSDSVTIAAIAWRARSVERGHIRWMEKA